MYYKHYLNSGHSLNKGQALEQKCPLLRELTVYLWSEEQSGVLQILHHRCLPLPVISALLNIRHIWHHPQQGWHGN